MKNYNVTWEINLSAEDATAAARTALEIMRDGDAIATVFVVTDEQGEQVTVDTEEVQP